MNSETPLFDSIKRVQKITSFHTPGHKGGKGLHEKMKSLGSDIFNFDVTTFPAVDSLHNPQKAIKRAQELMAEIYGVKHSFFLVGGSSGGNISMLLSSCDPGDMIILSRNCHKSVLTALILGGLKPILLEPEVDDDLCIFFELNPEKIAKAIKEHSDAKAVLVTNPTYNGISSDLRKISEICSKYGKILLVDEAHGAHLKFYDRLPVSAVDVKADLCVQSTHKVLSALSQGAVLHYNSESVNLDRVREIVSMFQTTSPNYLILMSIDLSRQQVSRNGRKIFKRLIEWCEEAIDKINSSTKYIRCLERADVEKRGYKFDPTKITINTFRTKLNGMLFEEKLCEDYGIQVDCADMFNVIALVGIGTMEQDLKKLVSAIIDMDRRYGCNKKRKKFIFPRLSTEVEVIPREAFFYKKTKRIPIRESAGCISAEAIVPYPPGIPIVIPGERISSEICEYLMYLSKSGIKIWKSNLNSIKVLS